ncbi:hypothetical protein OTR29_05475 [Rickettsia endosymbiont of Halotydeus destructor]
MSKKNLSSKSSINTPVEGAENAKESNKTLKASINTPENVTILNSKSDQEQTPISLSEIQQEQQSQKNKPAEKRTLKEDATLYGARAARAGLATGAAAVEIVKGVSKVAVTHNPVHIVEGVINVGEKVAKAYDPIDKLQQGAKIKEKGPPSAGLADKALNKIRTLPGGETTANVLKKTYKTLGSKAVRRTARIGGVMVSLALNPTPIGLGLAALSLSAVAYNVGKETLEVRADKRLDRKKETLENIKANYVKQVNLVVSTQKDKAKGSPALKNFLDTKLPKIYQEKAEPEKLNTTRTREILKAVRDTTLEITALVAQASSAGGIIAGVAAGVIGGGVNILGEADAKLVRMEQQKDKKNQINNLKTSIGNYENTKDLLEKERQAKIDTKALEEFLTTTPTIDKLSEQQLREHFNVTRAKVAERQEFLPPPEKTNYEKVKSAVKAGAGYFVESQFGDLKELYGSDKKNQDIKSPAPAASPELGKVKSPEIVKEKVKEQAQHMQESLTHGNVTAYKSSISAPSTTPAAPSHSKHNESSRG